MKRLTTFLCALLLVLTCGCGGKTAPTWQEQYDLGVKYLTDGNYEEAVIAFTAAIDIEPRRAEAYLGLADAYIALGDPDRAAQVLSDALETVDDREAIQIKLDEVSDPNSKRRDSEDGTYSISDYDESGHVRKITYYNAQGEAVSYTEYERDETGRLQRMHQYNLGLSEGSYKYSMTAFGADGRQSEYFIEWENGRTSRMLYHYTAGSSVATIDLSDSEYYPETRYLSYTMAAPEHNISVSEWSDNGTYSIYETDREGIRISDIAFNPDGTVLEEH